VKKIKQRRTQNKYLRKIKKGRLLLYKLFCKNFIVMKFNSVVMQFCFVKATITSYVKVQNGLYFIHNNKNPSKTIQFLNQFQIRVVVELVNAGSNFNEKKKRKKECIKYHKQGRQSLSFNSISFL